MTQEKSLLELVGEFTHRESAEPYLIEGEIEIHLGVLKRQISQTAAKKAMEVKLKKNSVVYSDRFKVALQEAYAQGLIEVNLIPRA